ncbi:hypothetical protein BDZ94DRAFT_1249830 [Collybia nuda]|uniref:USP domain-containing protein n=1 Tax=Collybia nuda TaxID=64659 RepID=A0A9P6CNP9_9AGAR|nr:hypothetical protein BDZ94DRAFT_1249830 [Collybia nuda]
MHILTPQEEQQEREGVELLLGMMGGDVVADQALRVLRKYNGNVQKAADAILGGDRGEGLDPAWSHLSQTSQETAFVEPKSTAIAPHVPQGSSSVIDLTNDDEEISRALQMSLETSQTETTFGPSDRAPDPAWQIVPSNAAVDPRTTQDDRSLKDAIQASLDDFNADELEIFPLEKTLREGGRPIALRPEVSGIAYAALVIQALFFVPQVRKNVANLWLPHVDVNLPRDSPEHAIWNLVELFTNLDLAQLSSIVDKEVVSSLSPAPWAGSTDSLGDLTAEFVRSLAHLIESHINAQKSEEDVDVHLFHFFHGNAEIRGHSPKVNRKIHDGSVVIVEIGDGLSPNDLVSRLATSLNQYSETGSVHEVIFEPSQLVMFQIKWVPNNTASTGPAKSSSDAFFYPKSFYLDQFLVGNLTIANQKRAQERQMLEEIEALAKEKAFITHFNNRDTLKDLRASVYYYEHIAESKGDEDREETIVSAATELKKTLGILMNKVEEIDRRIASLQAAAAVIFDCPELQQHRYDLRGVLMHTGLPGRKQIYSYVQDSHGVWWKTLDYTVTEVPEETVLTDPTGLHLSAGPYLLIYSRYISDEDRIAPVVWPKVFTDSVEEHNNTLFSLLQRDNNDMQPGSSSSSIPSLSFPYSHIQSRTSSMDVVAEQGMRYREFNC